MNRCVRSNNAEGSGVKLHMHVCRLAGSHFMEGVAGQSKGWRMQHELGILGMQAEPHVSHQLAGWGPSQQQQRSALLH